MTTQVRSGIITLLTDFGKDSAYVGEMKGSILSIAPSANIVDLTHAIPPQNVQEASWIFDRTFRSFPVGTIHVTVVDPGVGSSRQIIVTERDDQIIVSPDNGLLTNAAEGCERQQTYLVTNEEYFKHPISSTFHGRDIMGPVAAHLLNGASLSSCGQKTETMNEGNWSLHPQKIDGQTLQAEIAYIDSFGNLITNCKVRDIPADWNTDEILIETKEIKTQGISTTYSNSSPGSLIALIGSSGYLELSIENGNCAKQLTSSAGDSIFLRTVN